MKRKAWGVGRGAWGVQAWFGHAPRSTLYALLLLLPACSSYQLRGKVVEGPVSTITIVNGNDPRLDAPGIPGASLQGTLDPDHPARKVLSPVGADADGAFAMPIGATGAGFLEYDLRLVGRMHGYQSAVNTFRVPGSGKRVLVTLAPGQDTYNPEQVDVMQETLRMGEPYMNR